MQRTKDRIKRKTWISIWSWKSHLYHKLRVYTVSIEHILKKKKNTILHGSPSEPHKHISFFCAIFSVNFTILSELHFT